MKFLIAVFVITLSYFTTQAQQLSGCELDSIDGMEVMFIVEEPPEYEGGYTQFYKDFKKIAKFSTNPAKANISFVIDTEGNIRNFCSSKEIENLEELIENINHWKAGKQKGEKVPVRLMLSMSIRWG
ncbi:MAG: hypothetical protein CMO01_04460 [Thalassobius sp.]|nr:hypothetical protein [Thalassovita sp.]